MLRICAFFVITFGIWTSTAHAQISFVLSQVDLHAGSETYIAPSPITIDAEHGYSASLTHSARGSTTSVAAAQIDTYRWRITVQTKGGSDGYGTAIVVFRLTLSNASPVGVSSVVTAASQSDATVQISYGGAGVYKRCVTSATEDPGECAEIPEGSSYPATTWQAPVRTARVTTGSLLILAGGQVAQNALFDTVIVTDVFAGDTLTFSNPNDPKTDLGVWVNAQTEDGGQWSHETFTSTEDIIVLGENLDSKNPPPNGDEIVAFTARHPVLVMENAGWTSALENKDAPPFDDEIPIPIKFWVVGGDYVDQQGNATLNLVEANKIWMQERSGLRIVASGKIEDKTRCGSSNGLTNFFYKANPARSQLALEGCGYEPDKINVYLVNTLENDPQYYAHTFAGPEKVLPPYGLPDPNSLGLPIIVLSRTAKAVVSTLAHELGHAFALNHVCDLLDNRTFNDSCGFPQNDFFTNLMIPGSNRHFGATPRVLAEGQIFRALLSPSSVVNYIYIARPGRLQRACSMFATIPESYDCPHVLQRIWSDGAR